MANIESNFHTGSNPVLTTKNNMSYTIIHLGNGDFQATFHETGEVKECGPNLLGMIKYTYFENDDTYPPIGWAVTQKQLLEDYQPKIMKDVMEGKIKMDKISD